MANLNNWYQLSKGNYVLWTLMVSFTYSRLPLTKYIQAFASSILLDKKEEIRISKIFKNFRISLNFSDIRWTGNENGSYPRYSHILYISQPENELNFKCNIWSRDDEIEFWRQINVFLVMNNNRDIYLSVNYCNMDRTVSIIRIKVYIETINYLEIIYQE